MELMEKPAALSMKDFKDPPEPPLGLAVGVRGIHVPEVDHKVNVRTSPSAGADPVTVLVLTPKRSARLVLAVLIMKSGRPVAGFKTVVSFFKSIGMLWRLGLKNRTEKSMSHDFFIILNCQDPSCRFRRRDMK